MPTSEPSPIPPPPRVLLVITTQHLPALRMAAVALGLSLLVLGYYARCYSPDYGWSKLVMFGSIFADTSLPRLQRTPHYVRADGVGLAGYDGQFYAQIALDPSLRDPAFDHALDSPAYRARRIGLPALAFALSWGKPRRIIQTYALLNLAFWFVLLGVMAYFLRPWNTQSLCCLGAAVLGFGVVNSMISSLVDLPAAAMVFVAVLCASWGRLGAFAAALLTRETSALAVFGLLDISRPSGWRDWLRAGGVLAIAFVPLILWMAYVTYRFRGLHVSAAGMGNFALPLQAVCARFAAELAKVLQDERPLFGNLHWLYRNFPVHELLTIIAFFFQGLYLVLRPNTRSPFWRIGVAYLALGAVLGSAVWESTSAAARVLLPLTLSFHVLLARENPGWFWPFFILGSLSVPYVAHLLWVGGFA